MTEKFRSTPLNLESALLDLLSALLDLLFAFFSLLSALSNPASWIACQTDETDKSGSKEGVVADN